MITIKDFAKQVGVSYESVRKQVVRYADELDGHIVKVRRTQYLDDDAVEFLRERRRESPIIIKETAKDTELEDLRAENKQLLIKIAELQERLIAEQQQVKLLQEDKINLLARQTPQEAPGRASEGTKGKRWWKMVLKK